MTDIIPDQSLPDFLRLMNQLVEARRKFVEAENEADKQIAAFIANGDTGFCPEASKMAHPETAAASADLVTKVLALVNNDPVIARACQRHFHIERNKPLEDPSAAVDPVSLLKPKKGERPKDFKTRQALFQQQLGNNRLLAEVVKALSVAIQSPPISGTTPQGRAGAVATILHDLLWSQDNTQTLALVPAGSARTPGQRDFARLSGSLETRYVLMAYWHAGWAEAGGETAAMTDAKEILARAFGVSVGQLENDILPAIPREQREAAKAEGREAGETGKPANPGWPPDKKTSDKLRKARSGKIIDAMG